jgi:hypothetical protein
MKTVPFLFLLLIFSACMPGEKKEYPDPPLVDIPRQHVALDYPEFKARLQNKQQVFAGTIKTPISAEAAMQLRNYWVEIFSDSFYNYWAKTKWDFNGTSQVPGEGNIACGYFVTTLLKDMGLPVNRVKLAVCPSLQMMKTVAPSQPVLNYSSMSWEAFDQKIRERGKGIYIIGLDFHTGFVINDGNKNWFLHSNYIQRKGVMKELMISSQALRASKTRWLVSLTDGVGVFRNWLGKGS